MKSPFVTSALVALCLCTSLLMTQVDSSATTSPHGHENHHKASRIEDQAIHHQGLIEGTFLPHRVAPKKAAGTKDSGIRFRVLRFACLRQTGCLWKCSPHDVCLCLCESVEGRPHANHHKKETTKTKHSKRSIHA